MSPSTIVALVTLLGRTKIRIDESLIQFEKMSSSQSELLSKSDKHAAETLLGAEIRSMLYEYVNSSSGFPIYVRVYDLSLIHI